MDEIILSTTSSHVDIFGPFGYKLTSLFKTFWIIDLSLIGFFCGIIKPFPFFMAQVLPDLSVPRLMQPEAIAS